MFGPGLPPDIPEKGLTDSATCFEAIIHNIQRYTCKDIEIEAKVTFKFRPERDPWIKLSDLHQAGKTVKVVVTE